VKIAIATDFHSPWVGGPATFIDNFSAFLATRGHQVEIIAPSANGAPSTERRGNVIVRRMPTIPMPFGYGMRATARLDRVLAAVKTIRPDVIQIHHPFPLGFAAVHAARRFSVPIVAVNHTIPECSLYGLRESRSYPLAVGAFRRYVVWLLEHAEVLCTPTRTAATLLNGMGVRRHVEVISNGVDVSRFTPGNDKISARRDLGFPDKPTVLYTGRLDAEKDMETWLRAGEALLKTEDAHLVVGGEGVDKPRLRQLVGELGIESHVSFPGYLPVEQLPRLYQAADVYMISSAVELQSITTLEALATGLPIVAADARALPELVEDGHNGFLAPPGDVRSFAQALIALIRAPKRAKAMGDLSRIRAEGHSLAVVALRHEALLERVAAPRSTRFEATAV
jgi:glycosyltransferase involved in cell wall biosynthesis